MVLASSAKDLLLDGLRRVLPTDTTQAAVSIKVLIEQMREQIQNIE